MSKVGKYSNEERFDIEFKKRQNEIQSAISSWSQGEACREKILQISSSLLKEHDELTNLSKRLFENGSFTEQFKGLTKLEIESNSNSIWVKRYGSFALLFVGGFLTKVGEWIVQKLF